MAVAVQPDPVAALLAIKERVPLAPLFRARAARRRARWQRAGTIVGVLFLMGLLNGSTVADAMATLTRGYPGWPPYDAFMSRCANSQSATRSEFLQDRLDAYQLQQRMMDYRLTMAVWHESGQSKFDPQALDLETGPPEPSPSTQRLRRGSRAGWTTLYAARPEVVLVPAIIRYELIHDGAHPTKLADLAPYTFRWPLVGAESTDLQPAGSLERLISRAARPLEAILAEGVELGIDFAPEGTRISRLDTSDRTALRYIPGVPIALDSRDYTRRPRRPAAKTPLTEARLDQLAGDDLDRRWQVLDNHMMRSGHPVEARYVAAEIAIKDLIQRASNVLGRPAQTLEELLAVSGTALVNLEAVAEEDAELLIQTDGAGAWRVRTEYSTGLLVDEVMWIPRFGPETLNAERGLTVRWQERVGNPMWTIGSFRLAEGDEISLPSLANWGTTSLPPIAVPNRLPSPAPPETD